VRVVCTTNVAALEHLPSDACGVLLFTRADRPQIGSIGAAVKEYVEKHKFSPDPRAWDFVAIALSVFAADQAVPRSNSSDGWTRQIELDIAVVDPAFWNSQHHQVEKALQFLTTDRWSMTFSGNGVCPKTPEDPVYFSETSISLLSGGMDSLIGAVDLAKQAEKVLLVSQVAGGDRDKQGEFAKQLGLNHLQLTHGCSLPGDNEPSTRSRSIVFIAYGVLAATLLESYKTQGILARTPENGFMSINPPLTDARLGGLSTRTTHPVFIHQLQTLLNSASLRVQLANPYQFKTKGEMLKDCLDQEYITVNAHKSTSCGRFVRTGYRHCGRCVPCLVRRAAFHNATLPDQTIYKYKRLGKNDADHAKFDDVRSAALAVAIAQSDGLDAWLGTSLTSNVISDPAPYKEVVRRGLRELEEYLKASGVK